MSADPDRDILDTPAAGPAAVRGGAIRAAGYLLNAVLGAALAAILFRHLGRDDTGLYVTALSISAIVGGLSDLGLTALGVRELSVRPTEARAQLMRNLLGIRILLTAAGVMIALAFSLAVGYPGALVVGVALAGAGLVFQGLQSTLALSLMSRLRLGWLTVTEVGRQALLTVLVAVLVLLGAHLESFLALQIPVALVALGVTVALVRSDVPLRPSWDRAELRALVAEILPYSIAVALAVVYFRVSVIAVSLIASRAQLGYFSVSFRILEVLVGVPGLIVAAAFPIFARSARDDQRRFNYAVSRVFEVSLIIGALFALDLALGARLAIDLVGGAGFAPAAEVLRIQAIGLGGSFVAAVWSIALLSLGRRRILIYMNFGALLAGSALAVLLAGLDGARGAAYGTAATEVALAVVGGVVFARESARPRVSLRLVPRVAVAAGGAALLALVPGLPPVPLLALSTGIYVVLLLLMRAVPEEILGELRGLRGRRG